MRPYFGLGLMMTFLEQVYMGWWFSGGEVERGLVRELVGMGEGSGGELGEGRNGPEPNSPIEGEGCWNGIDGVRETGRRKDR